MVEQGERNAKIEGSQRSDTTNGSCRNLCSNNIHDGTIELHQSPLPSITSTQTQSQSAFWSPKRCAFLSTCFVLAGLILTLPIIYAHGIHRAKSEIPSGSFTIMDTGPPYDDGPLRSLLKVHEDIDHSPHEAQEEGDKSESIRRRFGRITYVERPGKR